MNHFILCGRIVQNPEVKKTEKYDLTTITVAVERPFKNSEGQIETDFLKVTFWDNRAMIVGEYCVKGMVVSILGRIQTRVNEVKVGDQVVKVQMNDLIGEQIGFHTSSKTTENITNLSMEE